MGDKCIGKTAIVGGLLIMWGLGITLPLRDSRCSHKSNRLYKMTIVTSLNGYDN